MSLELEWFHLQFVWHLMHTSMTENVAFRSPAIVQVELSVVMGPLKATRVNLILDLELLDMSN